MTSFNIFSREQHLLSQHASPGGGHEQEAQKGAQAESDEAKKKRKDVIHGAQDAQSNLKQDIEETEDEQPEEDYPLEGGTPREEKTRQ